MKFTCINDQHSFEWFNQPGNFHTHPVKWKHLTTGETYEGKIIEINGEQKVELQVGVFPLLMFKQEW